ncbi:unnamed protein product [Rhizoctonia solani]|uniref:Uncharacterized protein n=1 Tax=Rhizoctonia solani TaxID=456999 RepID=A0A8H3HR50_9AGAM|nr:unnamed protein product [Rhizoctonia solani]
MSFQGSHRSSASLSANQAPPSPFANKLRLANPPSAVLPAIPPPAPLGLPEMDNISLDSAQSKPLPIPHRRSTSPLRGGPTPAFDRSMDPEVEDEDELPWGERPQVASSPLSSSPGMNRFASSFATRVNALFADPHTHTHTHTHNRPRMSDAEIEAEAERSREASRREAERILTEEAAARRRAEEQALAQRAMEREQQQRTMERAQLGRPTTPTRGMSLSPMTSPKREGKEGESSWWGLAKSKLTPTKEKEPELTPAQQIAAEARKQEKGKEKEKGKKSIDWPATPGVRSTDPTLLAMAAASRSAASPHTDQHFMSNTLSSSPERQPTYSPKPIMPHEQLAREIEAQGGGRINSDFFGTRLSDGGIVSTPNRNTLPFANRATPSPAPSPLQPARAQTSAAQIGLSATGTPLGGRSPNASPDKSPNVEKDKKLSPVDDKERAAEREKEKDRRTATTITTTTTSDDAPPLYAQFTPAGALDVPLTLLTVARRFEKLEKWTVGHVRALEERMKDVERYLVDRETKSDSVGKEITALKTGIQDLRRTMETLREAVPPAAPPPQPQPQTQPQSFLANPSTPARRIPPADADARIRHMSSTSASSYATALSALNGELSNAGGVRTSVISLGSVEADGIDTRPSVAEVVTPMAVRQPLPPAPSTSASTSSFGSPIDSTSLTSLTSPRPSGSSSREFKPVVPSAAKDFTPPPPLNRVSSFDGIRPTSPPSGGLRYRLPYPTGDYTSNGQSVSPLSATAASFPMPPGTAISGSTLTLSGTAPLSIGKEKQKEKDETPLAPPLNQRAESVSPTPRKRYTVALSGGHDNQRPVSLPTQTAVFTTAPLSIPESTRSPPSSTGRSRSQSTYSTAPSQPPPSPSPASGSNRLRRAVSSSTDGGLASVFAQTEDWEDVRDKVLSPRLGEPKFVDPLVIRRKGAGKEAGSKPMPGAGRGKVPISQLVKFFDGEKRV